MKTSSIKWMAGVILVTLLALTVVHVPALSAGNWYAEYFANVSVSGGPSLTRYESDLHFEWGAGSPGKGIPNDNFSARFTRDEWFNGGTYRFSYRSDDGLRLWIDDALIINDWRDRAPTWSVVDHYVAQGTHRVRVEYYERGGNATLQAAWEKVGGGTAWRADYYTNRTLSNDPVLTRYDAAIDFDWENGSPDSAVPADNFSVRWSRTLGFEAGTYRFYASCDDGVRIYVDGQLVINAWQNQKLPNTRSGDIALSAGQHTVVVEYYEEGGLASAHVWWNRLDTLKGWEGRYFDNRDLRGGPALIRDDAGINFDWEQGAPVSWMPSDNFSVQWTRTINFTPGLYRFNTRSDDGMRLWIDDTILHMDYWSPQDNVWRYQDWHYLSGTHTLRVEYFEAAGNARMQFWWDYAATVQAARAMTPSPNYGFASAPGSGVSVSRTPVPSTQKPDVQYLGPWQAEYFDGRDLDETPVLVRTDETINFDWKFGSPAPEIPANQFAARWTGTFAFEAGRYRFTTTSDDGVRLYVNDRLVINSWYPMRGTRYATVTLPEGDVTIRVEYFERTGAAMAQLTWRKL
ncbi:MAG: PA14 domain-containing protein [Anaerolineae bacterium]